MSQFDEKQSFFRDALAGRLTRREVIQRGTALGLGAMVLGALTQESLRGAMAQDRDPIATFYSWMTDLHPDLYAVAEDVGMKIEVAPTEGFGFERFVAEAKEQKSTWDLYSGVTPFLEMTGLVRTETIEPWDTYLAAEDIADILDASKREGSLDGKLYVYPWLLDVISQGWNAEIVTKAGLDPEAAPKNWDEFIANSQKVKDSGAAPYGCVFDWNAWRSLIPITHSISTDVYSTDGIFAWTSDAAVQALETMKRLTELSSPDILSAGSTDGGVNATPDEQAFAAQQAGYYVKYANAHLRMAAAWPDPTQLRIGPLPVTEGGQGSTVFWNSGIVLFKYGSNKEKAAEFVKALAKDERVWRNAVTGNAETGAIPVGQMPSLKSTWEAWKATPPDFVAANPWVNTIYDRMAAGTATEITPCLLSVTQFFLARDEYVKYLSGEQADPKVALQAAQDAVVAEFVRQEGREPALWAPAT